MQFRKRLSPRGLYLDVKFLKGKRAIDGISIRFGPAQSLKQIKKQQQQQKSKPKTKLLIDNLGNLLR